MVWFSDWRSIFRGNWCWILPNLRKSRLVPFWMPYGGDPWNAAAFVFQIPNNDKWGQCISCGNCSTYCEMGIDVRAYAQKGQNIVRSSCVGCGICSAVCPRGVLKLENASTKKQD